MFEFGKNWESFSRSALDEDSVREAEASLRHLLGVEDLRGKSFLDVGCGSGLFSVAAARLGADPVVGTDVDPRCITVAAGNTSKFAGNAPPPRFQVLSVLDADGVRGLGLYDIVYAWGALHHTGRMWDAVLNAAQCAAPRGLFAIAIYNKHATSPAWRMIKKVYNIAPGPLKALMIYFFTGVIFVAKALVTRRNPLAQRRGMNFFHDVVDWVGGYPYEYASLDEIVNFVERLGFRTINTVPAQVPTGCNEFVFEKI